MTPLDQWKEKLTGVDPAVGLALLATEAGPRAKFSTSLGLEDQIITHLVAKGNLDITLFTLDTARLFQETYDLIDLTRIHYKKEIQAYFPNQCSVECLLSSKGPNSFYLSVENRKECCYIRKVEPLNRALSGAKFWITGIRAEQSANRQSMSQVEWDSEHQLIKYHPLFYWTQKQVEEFIEANHVPVNTLHKKGFLSIGCAPCTRAVQPGEDPRSGRWWWEGSAKECGLHSVNHLIESNK